MRRRIKAMSYGLAYGLSVRAVAAAGITPDEARGQMEVYFQRFGGVRDYLREVVDQARRDGYTQTILGRRRYLPDLTSDNTQRRQMAERMALNAPIQGSAADIIKVAMLRVDAALAAQGLASRLLLQVHDELVLEVARRAGRGRGVGPGRDGWRLPAGRADGRERRRRPHLGRGRALSTLPGRLSCSPVARRGRLRLSPARARDRWSTPGGGWEPAPGRDKSFTRPLAWSCFAPERNGRPRGRFPSCQAVSPHARPRPIAQFHYVMCMTSPPPSAGSGSIRFRRSLFRADIRPRRR